jgi:hypothetical protein
MSKKNDDIENKQDILEKTTQVYKAEGYVAASSIRTAIYFIHG